MANFRESSDADFNVPASAAVERLQQRRRCRELSRPRLIVQHWYAYTTSVRLTSGQHPAPDCAGGGSTKALPKHEKARATRRYILADVGVLRLVVPRHRQGVHERALWGVLVYRGEGLRARLEQGCGELVVDTRPRWPSDPKMEPDPTQFAWMCEPCSLD